ncbi:hypothetical protein SOP87_30075, partial [Bacillus cereus]|uniref:hypothetical protein n=5 Tax=Bacteria TaxID=2 RepID=UPI002B242AB0
ERAVEQSGSGHQAIEGADGGASEQINGHDSIDPGSIGAGSAGSSTGAGSDGDDSGTGKRRTRSDAGRTRGPRKSAPLDLSDLKDIIVMAHVAMATAFRSDLLVIDDSEGDKLAGAVQKVLRHYDLPDVASETKDWIGLILACGSVYGPRVAAAWAKRNTPPAPGTPQQEDNNVVSMVGAMNHPGPGL